MPKPKKSSPPATKEDIKLLMEDIGALYVANERWKDEIVQMTKDHLDITIENICRDLPAAKSDQIEVLLDRVRRLEESAGLV